MSIAAVGLGANLGDPAGQIAGALCRMHASIGSVKAVSSLWRTPPWGVADQPPFVNACALIETTLSPHELLSALKRLERTIGRTPGRRWGPRLIDVDILFFGDQALTEADLTIPHRHLFERSFVLAPLAEIAGDRTVAGQVIRDALARTDRAGLERLQRPDWPPVLTRENSVGEWIELRCTDGATISAWRAYPTGTPKGGMVVLQEIFGVNHHIRTVADRYAAEGYVAIAPALFDRVEKGVELGYDGGDMERARDIRGRTKLDDTLMDVGAALAAATEGGPVGVVGYCWGGSLAWAAAARVEGVKAAVGYYGGNIASMLDVQLKAPVMLHFGSRDVHIPLTDVEKIRAAHPDTPVHVYDADHGFNCDERASYDAKSAEVARERTLAFFNEYLVR